MKTKKVFLIVYVLEDGSYGNHFSHQSSGFSHKDAEELLLNLQNSKGKRPAIVNVIELARCR